MTPDRLAAAMPVVARALHGVARDLALTNEELLAALGFLTEVGRADEFVLLSDVLGLSRLVDDQTHAADAGTPSNVLGPFYLPGAPLVGNPGTIVVDADPTPRIVLTGVVRDADTRAPVAGAELDLWQTDAQGHYSNQPGAIDPWNVRGRLLTDAAGHYAVETVRPLHYTVKDDGPVGRLLAVLGRHPWRPAHIHVLASAPGYRRLVTQVYLAGGPYLDDDTISGVKQELVVPVVDGRVEFDIALAPDAPQSPDGPDAP